MRLRVWFQLASVIMAVGFAGLSVASCSINRADARDADCKSVDRNKQLSGRPDPAIMKEAQELLSMPMGSGQTKVVKGERYLFCIEAHNNRPHLAGPDGTHKGVTVYKP